MIEAPIPTQEEMAQSVKPVAADAIDKTFSDSIGVSHNVTDDHHNTS